MNSLDVIEEILDYNNVSSPNFRVRAYKKIQEKSYDEDSNQNLHDMDPISLQNLLKESNDKDIAIDTQWATGYIPVLDLDSVIVDTDKLLEVMGWTESTVCYVMESSPGKRHLYFNGIDRGKRKLFDKLYPGRWFKDNTGIVDQVWTDIFLKDETNGGFIRIGGARPPPKLLFKIHTKLYV